MLLSGIVAYLGIASRQVQHGRFAFGSPAEVPDCSWVLVACGKPCGHNPLGWRSSLHNVVNDTLAEGLVTGGWRQGCRTTARSCWRLPKQDAQPSWSR